MTFEKAHRVGPQRRIWRAVRFATLGTAAAFCALPAWATAAGPDVNDTVGAAIAAGLFRMADASVAADAAASTAGSIGAADGAASIADAADSADADGGGISEVIVTS